MTLPFFSGIGAETCHTGNVVRGNISWDILGCMSSSSQAGMSGYLWYYLGFQCVSSRRPWPQSAKIPFFLSLVFPGIVLAMVTRTVQPITSQWHFWHHFSALTKKYSHRETVFVDHGLLSFFLFLILKAKRFKELVLGQDRWCKSLTEISKSWLHINSWNNQQ